MDCGIISKYLQSLKRQFDKFCTLFFGLHNTHFRGYKNYVTKNAEACHLPLHFSQLFSDNSAVTHGYEIIITDNYVVDEFDFHGSERIVDTDC